MNENKLACIIFIISIGITIGLYSFGRIDNKTNTVDATSIGLVNEIRHTDTIQLHSSAQTWSIEDTLQPPTKMLGRIARYEVFANLTKGKIEKISPMKDSLVHFGGHPFLSGVWQSYLDHRPIVISPDIVWTLIGQGFARHISLNAEKFRDRLLGFDGKKTLAIIIEPSEIRLGDSTSNWEVLFPQFTNMIGKYTGQKYIKNLRSDFSTSTADTRIVSEIILMESVKAYFDYRVIRMGCGISKVTVEGSVEDWQKILKKLDYIETFDLKWWTDELRPIIHGILNTKKGNINKVFWSNMVQHRESNKPYTPKVTIEGWITRFFPFSNENERRKIYEIGDINKIALEYVKVPFVLEDRLSGVNYNMEFWAGLFGTEQDMNNYALKPVIGWAIVHSDDKSLEQPKKLNRYDHIVYKRIKQLPEELYSLGNITRLELHFIDDVNISDRIKEVNIMHLEVNGNINKAGIDRLKMLKPKTVIVVNGDKI